MAEFNKSYYRRQGKVQGAIEEQARIIKLLEQDLASNSKEYSGEMEWGLYKAIELIKGETND